MPAMLDRPGTAPVMRPKWVRVPPLALNIGTCSWVSSVLPTHTQRVRLLPSLLNVSVAEQQRHHPATVDQMGATPIGHSFRSVTQQVWRSGRQPDQTGSSPVQGADLRAGDRAVRQPSDTRFEAGSTPAGPTLWFRGAAWSARHCDVVEVAGSNPAGTTEPYLRGPAATAPGSHPGDRRFESCRGYFLPE